MTSEPPAVRHGASRSPQRAHAHRRASIPAPESSSSPSADVRPATEPAARYGLMSTLLWDFVQLDLTLVLVWVGIQLGLRPIKKLRDEIAAPLAARPAPHRRVLGAARNRSGGGHAQSLVPDAAHLGAIAAAVHRQYRASIAHADHRHAGAAGPAGGGARRAADQEPPADPAGRDTAAGALRESIAHAGARRSRGEHRRQESNRGRSTRSSARSPPNSSTARCNRTSIWAPRCSRSPSIADPSLLDDLLSNLVDNALKYTPAGGTVTVSAGPQERQVAIIAVEDTGPGIPEAERERVRQRFYRIAQFPRPRQRPGTRDRRRDRAVVRRIAHHRIGRERHRHESGAAIPLRIPAREIRPAAPLNL